MLNFPELSSQSGKIAESVGELLGDEEGDTDGLVLGTALK
jgi:hypothetical protein